MCEIIFAFIMQRFSVLLFVSSKQTRCFTSQMAEMAENRFRPAKTFEEEEKCVASAIPKSTIKTNGRLEFWKSVCGIRRFMEEKNANLDFNLLDASGGFYYKSVCEVAILLLFVHNSSIMWEKNELGFYIFSMHRAKGAVVLIIVNLLIQAFC